MPIFIPTNGSVNPSANAMMGLYFVFARGAVVAISLICLISAINQSQRAEIFAPPERAEPNRSMILVIAGGIMNGICDMFSVPPATIISIVPERIRSKPELILSIAEAQLRCTVTADVDSGNPEFKATTRAILTASEGDPVFPKIKIG